MLQTLSVSPVNNSVSPFLRWAGGKRWLVSAYPDLLPQTYNIYHEPFLGSGAMYFYMRPAKAILGDANADLINAYSGIKNDWQSIYKILEKYQRLHNKDFYYEIRAKNFRNLTKKAAQFIYLNRTCYNGLYRVNSSGTFNVPIGTRTRILLESDNFQAVSNQLKKAKLHTIDFEDIINNAAKGDFLFVDPPYTVKHNQNGFVQYNDHLFSWNDQIRLRDSIDRAVSKGVKVLLTNADHASIHDLYDGIGEKFSLNRLSKISGDVCGRGQYSELIVKCYKS